MISFENNNEESDELYWTKKYKGQKTSFKEKSGNKKPNNYRRTILVGILAISLMLIANALRRNSKVSFFNKSVEEKAIVVYYKYSSILVNQMDGSRLKNYYYEYYYYVDGEKIYSSDLLDEYRYKKCIKREYRKGDTLNIIYNKSNPSKSKIKCQ